MEKNMIYILAALVIVALGFFVYSVMQPTPTDVKTDNTAIDGQQMTLPTNLEPELKETVYKEFNKSETTIKKHLDLLVNPYSQPSNLCRYLWINIRHLNQLQ